MKENFRQSMAWLHTWSGLVVGWVLLAIFVTGTASYFRQEITLWMQPELHAARVSPDAATMAVNRLNILAPHARTWFITVPDERDPTLQIGWRTAGKKGKFERETLDAGSGEKIQARDTRGGEFFYRFHFQLQLPPIWGRWIVGFCAMFMLVAIMTGVITHRRIFKDFFTFRPKRGQRSWLDAHNASGVLALPFHLMITYTGLVTLMYLYMPWGITTAYQGDRDAYFDAVAERTTPAEASGVPAPMTAIAPLIAAAQKNWDGGRIGRITVDYPNDASATVRIARHDGDRISTRGEEMVFNGVSGERIGQNSEASRTKLTYGVFYGLHVARFAEPLLRWLFFMAGLTGCAMVATGLLLWSVARAPQLKKAARPGLGHRMVDALNIAAVAGLPVAIAGLFWANRLLPAQFPDRSALEIKAFFVLWLLTPLYAALRPSQRAWKEVMGTAAFMFAGLPLLNALTTHSHLGVTLRNGMQTGQWALAGFDLSMLALGMLLGFTAHKLGRWQPVRKSRAAKKPVRETLPLTPPLQEDAT